MDDNLNSLSLIDRYNELRKINPARDLIYSIMEATGRAEVSVRMWLSTGRVPSSLHNIISKKLGIDAAILFPNNN